MAMIYFQEAVGLLLNSDVQNHNQNIEFLYAKRFVAFLFIQGFASMVLFVCLFSLFFFLLRLMQFKAITNKCIQ